MKQLFSLLFLSFFLSACGAGDKQEKAQPQSLGDKMSANTQVKIETNKGNIIVELFNDKAPASAENFAAYAKEGFYNGTVFHRVIPNFMIQGGGFTVDMVEKSNRTPVTNEAKNGLKNSRGTLAMARTMDPHSATSQFFINLKDNVFLNHTSETQQGWGYAVFGKVTEGMEIVDAIAGATTGMHGGHSDVPTDAIVMKTVTVIE